MQPVTAWYEHIDLVQSIIVGLCGYIGYTMKRDRDDFKQCLDDLYEKYSTLSMTLAQLQGELHGGRLNGFGQPYARRVTDRDPSSDE